MRKEQIGNATLFLGDCLEILPILDKKDMILCDPPYGTTQCKWDIVIPFDKLWECYNKIIKDNGAVVLFGSEPFSSYLRLSNINNYRYDLIYQKNKTTGFLNAKKQPLNDYETISIFYKKQCIYNPQMAVAEKTYKRGFVKEKKSDCYGKERDFIQVDNGLRYPKRIIYFNNNYVQNQFHPTQKPVSLLSYLVKTYTNENETVLDNCMGSGTTGVACINSGRQFIGIEKKPEYFDIACKRIEEANKQNDLFREAV